MELYMLGADAVDGEDKSLVRARFPRRFLRAERCARPEDGLCLIAAGVLLYHALGVEDESAIACSDAGRPYIPGGPGFSISHSGGLCVLAVGRGNIGADIEKLDESNLIAAPAALTIKELEWIKPSPLERFHILWTRKESVYKAVGGYGDPKEIPALDGALPAGLYVSSVIREGFALSVCCGEDPGALEPKPIK